MLVTLVLVGLAVFGGVLPAIIKTYLLPFLCIPVLVWTAFRFGPRETATAMLLLSGIAIWGTLSGFGPFVRATQSESLFALQFFMGVAAVTALTLAAGVSEQRRAKATSSYLAAIVDSSDDAIIGKTIESIVASWNRGAERIFGYTAEEVLGQPITMLIPPDRVDEEPKIIDRLRRGERIEHFETVRRRKDGEEVDVSLTISPIEDATGKIIGISKIARDISERQRAKEELERLVRDLTDALAQVKTLRGLLPICASCRKIRSDENYWQNIETYVEEHTEASFSHGICPACMQKLYGYQPKMEEKANLPPFS